jgi:hypothetical protein
MARALKYAQRKKLSTWTAFEPAYLQAMREFDDLVAAGGVSGGDLRNGKGDAFNDFLVTLLENCSGKRLNTRPDVPGLSFRRHKLDMAYPDVPDPVELVVETKAAGVPIHPGNVDSQRHLEGRAGAADLEKRVKEASLKNIDIKAEAARTAGKGGGPTSDLGSLDRAGFRGDRVIWCGESLAGGSDASVAEPSRVAARRSGAGVRALIGRDPSGR